MLLAAATSSRVGQTNKGWSHIAKFFGRLWRKFSVCVRDKSLSIKRSQVWKLEIKKLLRNKKGRLVRFTFRQQFYFGWKVKSNTSLSFLKSIRFYWLIDCLIDWLISLIGCRGWRIFQNSNVCILFNTKIHSFHIHFFYSTNIFGSLFASTERFKRPDRIKSIVKALFHVQSSQATNNRVD